MLLAIAPDVFDWVEFRRIGWETFQMDCAVLLSNVFLNQTTAVCGQPIPDDRQDSTNVLLEVFEKLDHLRGLDAAVEESEIKIPNSDARHGRKALPIEGIL